MTRDKAKADTQHNNKGEHMSKEEWQGVEDTPKYTMEWRNDPVLMRKYVNIRRDGELSAQAVTMAPDNDNKVGIISSVMMNGQWTKNEFEFTTITEWVERFTK